MAENLLSSNICSGEKDSLLKMSPKKSSTLNDVLFSNSSDSLYSILFSTIDCFNNYSYDRVITFIQSLSLVHRIFNFDMYSFVIKTAIDVITAVLLVKKIPTLGLSLYNADIVIVEPDPNNISVITNNTFFFLKNFKLCFIIITINLECF